MKRVPVKTHLKATPGRCVALFVNSGTDYKIVDGHGNEYTPEEARNLFLSGSVQDYNLAFNRLACSFNFDMDKLRAYYKEQEKQWRTR